MKKCCKNPKYQDYMDAYKHVPSRRVCIECGTIFNRNVPYMGGKPDEWKKEI